MLARDIQSTQMSLVGRPVRDSFPNGNYQENPLPQLNSNFYVGYSMQSGIGISNVSGGGYPGSVFRKPLDSKTLAGFSARNGIHDSQMPATYSPMWMPDRVQNSSSYFPAQTSGPWTQQASFYDNPFPTPVSMQSSVKPASVPESVHESFLTYGNYRYGDNSGPFFNSTYNNGNLESHQIPYTCMNKEYSYIAASTSLDIPTCCAEANGVTYSSNNISRTEEVTSQDLNGNQPDNSQVPFHKHGEDNVDPLNETFEEIHNISNIIWNELRDDSENVGSPDNCKSQTTLQYGPLFAKRFSTFRRLVNQFYQDSRHKTKNVMGYAERDKMSVRNRSRETDILSETKEGQWRTEQKLEPSDSSDRNDQTQTSKQEDRTEKNIIRSLVCPDLKVKDPLVYLKFPFYSVEGEQLRPFLKRCLKLNTQTKSSDQTAPNVPEEPETSNLFDDDPSCNENLLNSYLSEPLECLDKTNTFHLGRSGAFISEFRVEDLKQTISLIANSYVEHLGRQSIKLSAEKKQWILDVYMDLRRLRETIFGPVSSVKAELQHEIFSSTGINVDISRNIVTQYSTRVYNHLPKVVKFFCSIPGFKELNFDDKKTLISESLLENWFLGWFNNVDDMGGIIIDVNHQILLSVDVLRESFPTEHSFIKGEMELASRLNRLELTPEEVIILKAVILLCPTRTGLKDPDALEIISRKCRECLRFLLYQNHDRYETILSEIEALFWQFRSVSGQYRNNGCREFISDITKDADFLTQISA